MKQELTPEHHYLYPSAESFIRAVEELVRQ